MKIEILPALVIAAGGVLFGLGAATFEYAEGLSYMSTDPAACANCHIMLPQYDSWQKASHKKAATCADCHLPDSFPEKYIAKSENGWNHSKAFTLQNFEEPITIKPENSAILQANCLRCHREFVHGQTSIYAEGAPRCARCHGTVGHGEQVGLGGPMPMMTSGLREDR